jgi:hypothetical protein
MTAKYESHNNDKQTNKQTSIAAAHFEYAQDAYFSYICVACTLHSKCCTVLYHIWYNT